MKAAWRRSVLAVLALFSAGGCAHLLGLDRSSRRPFEHRAHVLEGVACTRCHEGVRDAGDDGPLHLPRMERCFECHTQPHDTRDCASCHGLPWIDDRASAAKCHLRFSHAEHQDEVSGNCVRCHVDVDKERQLLLPPMAACLACHEHREEFDARDCSACHVDLVGEASRPESHVVHGLDFIRDHGMKAASAGDLCSSCHGDRFCLSCHGASVPALPSRAAFDLPRIDGLHRAGFAARHAEEARVDPGMCTSCHSESSCQSCHEERGLAATGEPRRSPHPPGWLGVERGANAHGPAARRDPLSCASCHGGAGEALCVRCHQVGGIGGNIHPRGWTSARSKTGEAPCRLCHLVP